MSAPNYHVVPIDDHRGAASNNQNPKTDAPAETLSPPTMYPPKSFAQGQQHSQSSLPLNPSGKKAYVEIELKTPGYPSSYDPERAGPSSGMPAQSQGWDFFQGVKNFESSYGEFDSRNASEKHLAFADGDTPKNGVSKFYHYLLNVSIVTRWFLFIVPILGIIWIPGILGFTKFPNAKIWDVKLLWWSIWLSVVWGGWWIALAASRIIPLIVKATVGVVAVGTRRYIDWMYALHRYIALFLWLLTVWITWQPLIDNHQSAGVTEKSRRAVDLCAKLWFSFFICAAILLGEKFAIQWIAGKFHERSYAERIADQKFAVSVLVTLYRNSSDVPGRSDTLRPPAMTATSYVNPRKILKQAMKGVRAAATTTTTVFGNVASEIAGSSVLQPNSPQAMVKTALDSANKSRLLARRIFYSFVRGDSEFLLITDIARYFTSKEQAEKAYALFDKDGNGDVSREEVEMACLDFHREQLSIEHSMQDLDSAVGRLDNILMSLYVVIAAIVIAVALEAQVATLIASAGTLVLGLSWLIGASLAEVLTSIIFLFIKHPFDVGDRIDLDSKKGLTVKEIRLLSTIFLDSNSVYVQAPNVILNGMFIQNIRRSPQTSETFTLNVGYGTSFESLETLREKMLEFLKENKRDYQQVFDVAVVDFSDQDKMTLSADIKYKSNAQQGALKAKRRNKWICALKTALAEVGIYGPSGDPNAASAPAKYTQVPWAEVKAEAEAKKREELHLPTPTGGWKLADKNAGLLDDSDDVFGETDQLHMTNPRRTAPPTQAPSVQMPSAVMPMPVPGVQPQRP